MAQVEIRTNDVCLVPMQQYSSGPQRGESFPKSVAYKTDALECDVKGLAPGIENMNFVHHQQVDSFVEQARLEQALEYGRAKLPWE